MDHSRRPRRLPLARVVLLAGSLAASAHAQAYPVWAALGDATYRELGTSAGGCGDVDLDGTPEVLVGGRDQVRVLSGATGAILRTLSSPNANGGFGRAVSDVGDGDGDGIPDILVGAPTGGLAGTGQAFLFSGATGATIQPFSYAFSPGFGASVSGIGDATLDGIPDFAIGGSSLSGVTLYSGATRSSVFTVATAVFPNNPFVERPVAPAGDLDADGHADLLVGEPPAATLFSAPGIVRVYSGLNGTVLRSVTGPLPGFGISVAFLGDVTWDGIPDYVVGSPPRLAGLQPPSLGWAHVVSGATGAIAMTVQGAVAGDAFGTTVAGLGDLDGDGAPDFIVGAPAIGPGYAAVFSGATGTLLMIQAGSAASDAFGVACAGTGDLNGDSIPDFVVGEKGSDPFSLTEAGGARVLSYAGVPAGSSTFGSGCPGQSGAAPLILTGGGAPVSTGNARFRILLGRARPAASAVLIGGFSATAWGTTQLPLSLGVYGMPACSLFVSADLFFPAFTTIGAADSGRAGIPMPIPTAPSLAGTTGFLQWLVVDPGPAILPAVLSQALQVTVL